ncbi:hypothetical protein H6P81_000617 [Aristolochia fimbriata]|uniref:Uncharacterized protein n=1 Tax=Aristolochia fimbriata TaxID=158543 RepID=A0AAV7F614_ARIFI|nr:hypothetical protein H6P81_000617 [Aristolochia fimbriata]
MVPNVDLFLLAFLHATLICCILLVCIFLLLICLLAASTATLFSIIIIDAHDVVAPLLELMETARANLELGFTLLLKAVTRLAVDAGVALEPHLRLVVSEIKARTRFSSLIEQTDRPCE